MSNLTPPKLFLSFFRWYCHPKLLKYIEGDLMELYQQRKDESGKLKADIKFIVEVILLFRPGIIRPAEGHQNLNIYGMYKSYFKIGWRTLLRNKGYSLINIIGLAAGMTITMLIALWVTDEVTFNTSHENYERIAQIYQHQTFNNEITTAPAAPQPIGPELKAAYKDDFKHVVRAWWIGSHVLALPDKKVLQNGNFMDPEAIDMLSFNMVKGNRTSLQDPASILLSESSAKALFGDADPLEKILRIDNMVDVKVTGVFKEFPPNSQLHSMQFMSTWDLWTTTNGWLKDGENDWNGAINVFVEISPNTTFDAISSKIKNIRTARISPEQASQEKPELFLHPMSQWHLYTNWENGVAQGGRVQNVWLLGTIGLFVLILACINFMNLSTAQSEKRSKEVGIRKSIGSERGQLIHQFLTESFLVVLFAFALSIVLVTVSLPWFNDLASKEMVMPWSNLNFWLMSLAFIVITSLLAGSYPAFFLSSFKPIKALKEAFKANRLASIPRQTLVVFQFTVSVVLIVGTIVVWKQVQYAKDRPVGYSRVGLIMIRKNSPEFWGKFQRLKNKLEETSAVSEMAESTSPATETWFNQGGFTWSGKDPNLHEDFATMGVTHEYGKTMGWTFVQGRDFSRDFSTDSSAVVLNEAAVRFMGLKEPLHEEIIWDGKKLNVIGVIKDMIVDSPYEQAKQTIFWLNYEGNVWINIRLNPLKNAHESLLQVEKVFQKLFPSIPFDYKFVDQEFALKFEAEERIGKIAGLFSVLAILISCLGLLGMASFMAEQRKKEIGIRKILGASVSSLWRMLSTEFVVLVSISCLIGIPLAGYFLNQWLQNYEYHTETSWWVFVLTAAGSLAITLLTISFQTIKASLVNPVNSLKSE